MFTDCCVVLMVFLLQFSDPKSSLCNETSTVTAVGFKYYVCPFLRVLIAYSFTPAESDIRNICIRRQCTQMEAHVPKNEVYGTLKK